MSQSYSRGVFWCLVATICWGAMFPVMNGALARIDPFTFTALRYLIAGTAFVLLLLYKEGRAALSLKGQRFVLAWALGSAGFAGFGFLVFLGQQLAGREGALAASIMMATQPMLGVLVNWLVRRIAPPLPSIVFVMLSFLGALLVITKGDLPSLLHQPGSYGANALILGGALSWVIYTVGAAFFPHWSPLRYTTLTTLLGLTSVLGITAALLAGGQVPVPAFASIGAIAPHLAYMALFAGFVGVLSWNMGNRILTPLNGVLFMDVVPLTAFTLSAVGGIIPGQAQILGGCITGAALVMNNLYLRRRAARSALPAVAAAPAR